MSSESLPTAIDTKVSDLPLSGDLSVSSGSVTLSVESPDSTAINPDIYYTVVTNSNDNTEFTLANASGNGIIKRIQSKKMVPIYITTTETTLVLDPNNPSVDLIYNSRWYILNGKSAIHSQQGSKLVGTGNTGGSYQGTSVALSSDGTTLAVGGYNDNSVAGATWIFTRSGSTWTQQGSKLVGTGATGVASQGQSVAISSDGNTVAIGGYTDNSNVGAVWVYTRSGSTWTQQGSKLVGTGATGTSYQGTSVALSSDGTTLAIGGYGDNSAAGATWIFTRSGSTWSQQGSKLVGTGATGAASQGQSVDLSANGNVLAVGGGTDNSNAGAVWIFTRSGSTWTQLGSRLVAVGFGGTNRQGYSISLSADGATLAIGSLSGDVVGIFIRSGNAFTQQGSVVTDLSNAGITQGYSVSLSADGNILAYGAIYSGAGVGAAFVWARSNGVWYQQSTRLIGTGNIGNPYQGFSIALSGEGNILAVGAVWIYI